MQSCMIISFQWLFAKTGTISGMAFYFLEGSNMLNAKFSEKINDNDIKKL